MGSQTTRHSLSTLAADLHKTQVGKRLAPIAGTLPLSVFGPSRPGSSTSSETSDMTTPALSFSIISSPAPTSSGGTLSSSPTMSSTPAAAPTQSSAPTWSFASPNSATTCDPFRIGWHTQNVTAANMADSVVTLYIESTNLNSPVNLTMALNVPLTEQAYTWSAVTVPPGSYVILGVQTNGTSETSPSFFVQSGPNTTCVTSTGASGGTSLNNSNNHSSSKTGAIAGGVVGGLVLIACLVTVVLFLRRKKTQRRTSKPASRRSRRGGDEGDWGGLDSVDYKPKASLDSRPSDSRYDLYTRAMQLSSLEGGAGPELTSLGEKTVPEPGAGLGQVRRGSSAEPTSFFDYGSLGAAAPTLELAHLSSTRSYRSSFDTGVVDQPSSPIATATANPRRASRTPRKPVPAYEPTQEELNELAVARAHSTRSSASQISSSTIATPTSTTNSRQHRSTPSSSTSHKESLFQGLQSKSSGHFEHQPVHYLIPDPPPPRRD